ncbi:MAG TPA: hypothetical protein VJ774_01820 [Actinomycetota bacterium]|nr:hypothetical protein [Actinomycetota bacterium]
MSEADTAAVIAASEELLTADEVRLVQFNGPEVPVNCGKAAAA